VKAVEARKAERDASTIEGLAELYIELHAKKRKRSWAEDQRILGKDILPAWRNRKAKDITRRDVVALLDKIAKRGAGVQANRTLAVIRKMFNFAMGRSLLDASPCVAILAPAKENQRDRNLSQDEIRVFWEGLAQARMDEKIKLTLKLMLATAQRKGEIVNAAWTEFDLKSGWWTIPAERAKNGRAHRVPLAPIVLDLLKRAKELSGDSPFVFPSPRGGKAITGPAVDHALRVNRDCFKANGSPVADFTPHDLRRTAASMMTSIKIPRLVVSKILNHVETGITAVYDRHSYDDEKRQALEAWARKLENILTGKEAKVIPLMKR
jgi:integrase